MCCCGISSRAFARSLKAWSAEPVLASAPYVTLMASLPALGPMLAARQAPINRERFRARLKLLSEQDRQTVEKVLNVVSWQRIPMALSDEAFVAQAQAVLDELQSETLCELVRSRMELRTIVAALRRRQLGMGPSPEPDWGVYPVAKRISERWSDPGFRLENGRAWLPPAKAALERGDAVGLERILIETAWTQAARLATRHNFDLEAVALYAVRLDLLVRWTRYDAEAAAARFSAIVREAMAEAPQPFGEVRP